jgi:hypothetical protein
MANLVKLNVGSDLTFKASGGTALWTPTSVAAGAGRISAVMDLGAAPRARLYRWRMQTRWVATVTAGNELRLYLITSNASGTAANNDGGIAFGDAAVSVETYAQNAYTFLGAVVAGVAEDKNECASGTVEILDRYIGVMCWNASATKALSGTAADHVMTLTPIMDEIQ